MDAQKYIEGRAADRMLGSANPEVSTSRIRWNFMQLALWIPLVCVGFYAYSKWSARPQYPFGPSHCCDKAIAFALRDHAMKNAGWFPHGESSPEASLSLLYRDDLNILYALPGKSVPEATVRTILEGGGLLSPTSCGWHYVEGLRVDDAPRLGLFWDKAGLGHNGQRLPEGGHTVFRVDGSQDYVRGKDWPAFLIEQAELHRKLKREPEVKREVVE